MTSEKPEGKKENNNVKCSFCGNDTFCDQCQTDSAKGTNMEHVCYDCYQGMNGVLPDNVKDKTHVCIPPEKIAESFQQFINDVTARAFMELWNAEKKKLKEMSRQDLAQTSFFEGARFMFDFMQRMSKQEEHRHEEGHEHKHEEHKHE
ncbi:Uncharacterised protein [Candidatus Bilamarchaeum dharawalense]|uniref:Uncharacterized protein n=1 Tax=Candidatus Bilamarchaeum dharawalense TaxID=2885759 RepID=A0A5E4LNU9_9ARCH|nr:Uncharacterised protein [Candidatus Bilamarchaeum dharawalense]